jgi:hypothetical protein
MSRFFGQVHIMVPEAGKSVPVIEAKNFGEKEDGDPLFLKNHDGL